MPAGMYRDMVNIKSDTSADGAPSPNYGATIYEDVPCQIEATSGNETYRGKQLEAHVDFVVTMHYMESVLPDMRLDVTGGIYNGRFLNVVNVLPKVFHGRATTMDLYCREKVVL